MQRKRLYLFAGSLALLFLTVPWFFTEEEPSLILGYPVWAAWAIGSSLVYACAIAFFLGKYWNLAAGSDDETEDPAP
ncbi:MAG: hypothetical protein AAF514_08450 [Verrucomicrobiota bacterium]